MILSDTYQRALIAAEAYHHEQMRKATDVPYFSHLLGVSSLVLEVGGTETEAIAALLHDAPEDAGGAPVIAEIEANFGIAVGAIVSACSDAFPLPGETKPPWRARKEAYIEHLKGADSATMLVSAADKLHNLRAIQSDHRVIGDAIFDRFGAEGDKKASVLWYYQALLDVYIDPHSPRDARRERLTASIVEILGWFDRPASRN